MMNIQQPIILIGAGRSGTTLLTRLFDQHPDIDFRGETAFLLPRLWLETWEDRFWFNWQHYTDMSPQSSCEAFPIIHDNILDQARKKIGNIIAHAFVDILSIDTHIYKAWGYKEIWNGSSQFQYDWLPYHIVFPQAIWVHLIRNPFSFIESCANWNNEKLTFNYMRDRLIDWASIINHSRKLVPTGRYIEVRYEDIIAQPQETIQPVFERMNLTWHPDCEKVLTSFVLRSNKKLNKIDSTSTCTQEIEEMIKNSGNAAVLMKELNYKIPETIPIHKDSGLLEHPQMVNLHIQNPTLQQPHQPQYFLNLQLLELQQQYLREYQELRNLYQQMQQQYQDILASETYQLAQKILQSWLMKLWRFLRK